MKTTVSFIALLLCATFATAQILPQTPWTWVEGDNTVNHAGNYGTMGVADPANKPGARNSSATWIDASGNLWLLGGSGLGASGQGYLNDLWKYDPANGNWTWIKGDNSVNQAGVYGTCGSGTTLNKPGASYASVSWTDSDGNLWLFGGFGYNSSTLGLLNALWKYNPSTNQWTWVCGDNAVNQAGIYGAKGVGNTVNKPGARYGSQSWTDAAGDLWLYGGYGYAAGSAGILNDVWKYRPSTNQWTWVNGDNTANQPGIYGTKGTPNATNKPGARYMSSSWKDQSGNLWLFGGYGFDETFAGNLNDMWKYNPATNQWTWMNGDKLIDQKAVFGALGVTATLNKPGSRYVSSSWTDIDGSLWMFGGYGYDAVNSGYLNDLWKYNTTNNTWTWVKGDNAVDQRGVYGEQGTPDPGNKSGSRTSSVSWSDGAGNLWLFGGIGYDGNITGALNDLWKINSSQIALPLKLLTFGGILDKNAVRLSWQSEQESNFSHFAVQRSFNGNDFSNIGTIAGNNNNNRNDHAYTDLDQQVHLEKKIFYRLLLLDKDGKFSYSRIIRFDPGQASGSISTYPNPATNTLNISVYQPKKGNIELTITAMNGTVLQKANRYFTEGRASLAMDVSSLPAATYILSSRNEAGTKNLQFIKQ